MPVTINISKVWTRILGTVAVLSALTGTFTLSGGIQWASREIRSHQELDLIPVLQELVIALEEYQEMSWEVMRLLTDDDDTLDWYYVDSSGQAFDVDIRATAENIELAFVRQTKMVYPIYWSPADRRKYIIDFNNENLYLYQR